MPGTSENRHAGFMGDHQRVVVTGIGMVTPLGIGKAAFTERLFAGHSAIATVSAFDTAAYRSHMAAEVTGFLPRDFISVKNIRRMDRLSQFTTAAARLALEDAGVTVNSDNRDRIGMILGTSFGPTDVTVRLAEILIMKGPALVNPSIVPNTVMNAPAGHASIELGFRGVNTTVTQYAVSGETAIAYAVSEIRRGTADCILAGGADILSPFYYEALTRFRSLSPLDGGTETCRPFDRHRNGAMVGEGSGLLVLESLAAAMKRGCEPYCEITGIGMGASSTAATAWPRDAAGLRQTIQRTLESAGLHGNDLQAISAAANGGPVLDAAEAAAYEAVFGIARKTPRITALKGAIGESFSGGGMRACALALSMQQGALPRVAGLSYPCNHLNYIMNKTEPVKIDHALLTGVSFGGTYACLIFSADPMKERKL